MAGTFDKIGDLIPQIQHLQSFPHPANEPTSPLPTAMFLAVMNVIYIELFCNSSQRLTPENIDRVEKFVTNLLESYFEKWRLVSRCKKDDGYPGWDKTFIPLLTYKNLRYSIYGFFHLARNVFKATSRYDLPAADKRYLPFLNSNTSALESLIGQVRAHNNQPDTPANIERSVSAVSLQFSSKAHKTTKGASYSSNDIIQDDTKHVERRTLSKQQKLAEKNTILGPLTLRLGSDIFQLIVIPKGFFPLSIFYFQFHSLIYFFLSHLINCSICGSN